MDDDFDVFKSLSGRIINCLSTYEEMELPICSKQIWQAINDSTLYFLKIPNSNTHFSILTPFFHPLIVTS